MSKKELGKKAHFLFSEIADYNLALIAHNHYDGDVTAVPNYITSQARSAAHMMGNFLLGELIADTQ